jgi:hypothetical protein
LQHLLEHHPRHRTDAASKVVVPRARA